MKQALLITLLIVVLIFAAVLVASEPPATGGYTCWRLVDGRCLPPVSVTPAPTRPPVYGTWPLEVTK